MNLDKYRSLFVREARECLNSISEKILSLSANPGSELYQELFRLAHSLKGMASTMGAEAMKLVGHELEGFFDKLRNTGAAVDQETIVTLLGGIDTMETMLREIEESGVVQTPPDRFQTALRKMYAKHPILPIQKITSFRVEANEVDRLVEGLGELMILNSQIEENFPNNPEIGRLQHLSRRLYDRAFDLRMLPFEVLVRNFSRLTFDLSRTLGKEVRLQVMGSAIRMDRMILEELADPLIHLIRNAMDHGIESRETRIAHGKEPTGTITLGAERHGDRILIYVQDDGKGIHVQAVKETAIRSGLVNKQSASLMNEQEVLMLMTRPGFTTAEDVSEISGRGVGLDVVRSKIELLGGSLTIRSAPRNFTRFEIQVPLALAVIPAVLMRIGALMYAVPLSRVERFLLILKKNLIVAQGRPFVVDSDQMLYLSHLHSLLNGQNQGAWPDEFSVFVTEHQNRKIAWAVDELISERDILVRSLGEPLSEIPCYSGAAILSKGEIVPVLDMEQLYSEAYS